MRGGCCATVVESMALSAISDASTFVITTSGGEGNENLVRTHST